MEKNHSKPAAFDQVQTEGWVLAAHEVLTTPLHICASTIRVGPLIMGGGAEIPLRSEPGSAGMDPLGRMFSSIGFYFKL